MWNSKRARVAIGLSSSLVLLLSAVAVATGATGNLTSGNEEPSTKEPAPVVSEENGKDDEQLPCTGLQKPINFDVYSAGPAPEGLPLEGTMRRCDPSDSYWPNNYVNYAYGSCEIPPGATGCYPPLQIQTWPACQRAQSEYTVEGKPLPFRTLAKQGGAEVVEFTFPANRIEVYTGTSTIVLFGDMEIARKAVDLLRSQESGEAPATNASELRGAAPERLPAPADGSTEGTLPC